MPVESLMTDQLELNDIELLPISAGHLIQLSTLPFHHRNPFDRLIISQAIVDRVPIVSVDPEFDKYPIERLWCQRPFRLALSP